MPLLGLGPIGQPTLKPTMTLSTKTPDTTAYDSAFDAYLVKHGFGSDADIETCPDDLYNAAHAAAGQLTDLAYDAFIESTARLELNNGRSVLASHAFNKSHFARTGTLYSKNYEPSDGGMSPCDLAQNTRLDFLTTPRKNAGPGAVMKTLEFDVINNITKNKRRTAIYNTAVVPNSDAARDSGIRNTRNILDYPAGREIFAGDLPLPVPPIDLNLVIADLPDKQRSVVERLSAGDTAAEIARDDNTSRAAVTNMTKKIRTKLLAADPSLADGRIIDGRRNH